jgi:hypothetical protein
MNDNITVVATKTLIAGLVVPMLEDESVEDITGMNILTPRPCIRLLVMPDAAKCKLHWRESGPSKDEAGALGSGWIHLKTPVTYFRAI